MLWGAAGKKAQEIEAERPKKSSVTSSTDSAQHREFVALRPS